jgi:Cu/Ag efflux protein CusF
MQQSSSASTSNLASIIKIKDRERQRLAADMAKFRGEVITAQATAKAIDIAVSKTTQERDEISFKRAEAIKAERKAADKARKIRTMAEVVRRNRRRSASQ